MKVDAQDDENPFELDGLVIKPGTVNVPSPKAARQIAPKKKGEYFARREEWHDVQLDKTKSVVASHLFNRLFRYSFSIGHPPFTLPVEHITELTGMDRRQQLRAIGILIKAGVIRIERKSPHDLPIIIISGTTNINRKTI